MKFFNISSLILLSLVFSAGCQEEGESDIIIILRRDTLSEKNHQDTLQMQDSVIAKGQDVSQRITSTLTRPLLAVNNRITSAAGTLPSLLAAGGAAIGTAISTPIQAGALAVNQLATGITGALVSIPVSVVAGGTAGVVGAYESGREFYNVKVSDLEAFVRTHGSKVVRPLSAVTGAHSVVAGMALHTIGSGMNRIGNGVQKVGQFVVNAGGHAKTAGNAITNYLKPESESHISEASDLKPTITNATTPSSIENATTPSSIENATTPSSIENATTPPSIENSTTSPVVASTTPSSIENATTPSSIDNSTTSPAIASTTPSSIDNATISSSIENSTTSPVVASTNLSSSTTDCPEGDFSSSG